MARSTSGSLLYRAFKALVQALLWFALLLLAWLLKIAGMVLTKLGELVERIKIKRMS